MEIVVSGGFSRVGFRQVCKLASLTVIQAVRVRLCSAVACLELGFSDSNWDGARPKHLVLWCFKLVDFCQACAGCTRGGATYTALYSVLRYQCQFFHPFFVFFFQFFFIASYLMYDVLRTPNNSMHNKKPKWSNFLFETPISLPSEKKIFSGQQKSSYLGAFFG